MLGSSLNISNSSFINNTAGIYFLIFLFSFYMLTSVHMQSVVEELCTMKICLLHISLMVSYHVFLFTLKFSFLFSFLNSFSLFLFLTFSSRSVAKCEVSESFVYFLNGWFYFHIFFIFCSFIVWRSERRIVIMPDAVVPEFF